MIEMGQGVSHVLIVSAKGNNQTKLSLATGFPHHTPSSEEGRRLQVLEQLLPTHVGDRWECRAGLRQPSTDSRPSIHSPIGRAVVLSGKARDYAC